MRSDVRSPEGATGISGGVRGSVVNGRPPGMSKRQHVECFRASRDKPKTQGKPWAKFSWPFGPKTRLQLHSSFRQMSKLQPKHFPPGYKNDLKGGRKDD
jgi:hypothetical protein